MAAMTTVLTEIPSNAGGTTKTYTTSGHLWNKVKLVIDKRRVPEGKRTVAEYSVAVIHSTEDADGLILDQKAGLTAMYRAPRDGQAADTAAILVIFKDIVNSDEFANSLNTLEALK